MTFPGCQGVNDGVPEGMTDLDIMNRPTGRSVFAMPTNAERKHFRHQRILDAALDVFARDGYHAAAVEEIASLAETSKGGLYFHFPGKQSLFLALLDRSTFLLLERIEARMAGVDDPIARVDAALRGVLHIFATQRPLARLLLLETMGAGPEFQAKLVEIHRRFAAFIARNLDAAAAAGIIPPLDAQTVGLAWFGALNQVVTTWLLDPNPGDLEAAYPALRTLFLRGVGVPEERIR